MRESVVNSRVFEAMAKPACALCTLHQEMEDRFIESFFAEMVMDGKSQAELAKQGLCRYHLYLVLETPDKLGAALALRTLVNAALAKPGEFSGWSCFACRKLERADRQHAEIMGDFFACGNSAWLKAAAEHLCLPHLDYLLEVNLPRWRAKTSAEFESLCRQGSRQSLESMTSELEWFIKKFDYRMRDEPWNGTEDIVQRAVEKLAGRKGGRNR